MLHLIQHPNSLLSSSLQGKLIAYQTKFAVRFETSEKLHATWAKSKLTIGISGTSEIIHTGKL
jgi:hypothetical protein